jgi:redox-sensing transcriptional repressor
LPRYYRFLLQLKKEGIMRISSRELSERMGLTASQIRQDLNCFGGFGQQGYGYDVDKLYGEIGGILGLDNSYRAVLIGVGNLGKAVTTHIKFEERGFILDAMFDREQSVVGSQLQNHTIRDISTLPEYLADNTPDAAFLCLPYDSVEPIAELLYKAGVRCFWNFSHFDLTVKYGDVIMENVHLTDSLMTLCYRMNDRDESHREEK